MTTTSHDNSQTLVPDWNNGFAFSHDSGLCINPRKRHRRVEFQLGSQTHGNELVGMLNGWLARDTAPSTLIALFPATLIVQRLLFHLQDLRSRAALHQH
jgi:hypothetical protein